MYFDSKMQRYHGKFFELSYSFSDQLKLCYKMPGPSIGAASMDICAYSSWTCQYGCWRADSFEKIIIDPIQHQHIHQIFLVCDSADEVSWKSPFGLYRLHTSHTLSLWTLSSPSRLWWFALTLTTMSSLKPINVLSPATLGPSRNLAVVSHSFRRTPSWSITLHHNANSIGYQF